MFNNIANDRPSVWASYGNSRLDSTGPNHHQKFSRFVLKPSEDPFFDALPRTYYGFPSLGAYNTWRYLEPSRLHFCSCQKECHEEGSKCPNTAKKQGFWAVGASSCSCQKECHEEGSKCANTAKRMDSGAKHSFLTIQNFPKWRQVIRNYSTATATTPTTNTAPSASGR